MSTHATRLTTFTSDDISILVLTNQIISAISIASCGIILIIHWFFKEIRNFIFNIVMFLCISNILYCSTAYFPYSSDREENKAWCAIQAFMILTFQYLSWILSCVIGYSCFISVIKRDHLEKHKTVYMVSFLAFALVVSLSLASIILFTDSYGPAGGWCWVDVYRCSTLVHKLILFYYCVNWFFIILNAFFIFKVINILLSQNTQNTQKKYLVATYHRLKWFPILQIICIVPSTISRMYNVFETDPLFVLALLQTVFGSLIGLGYLIIYIRIPQVKSCLNVFFAKLFRKTDHIGNGTNISIDYTSDNMSERLQNKLTIYNRDRENSNSSDII